MSPSLPRRNPPSLRWLSLTIVLGTQFNEGKEKRRKKKTHIYHYQPSHWEQRARGMEESASEKQSLKANEYVDHARPPAPNSPE